MASKKIFEPADFKKPEKSNKKWIVVAAIIIIVVVAVIFGIKSCNQDQNNETLAIPQDTTAVDDASSTDTTAIENQKSEDPNMVDNNVATQTKEINAQAGDSFDVEAEALKTIRGDYGNNPQRKELLGDKYQRIQKRVNELKREGVF